MIRRAICCAAAVAAALLAATVVSAQTTTLYLRNTQHAFGANYWQLGATAGNNPDLSTGLFVANPAQGPGTTYLFYPGQDHLSSDTQGPAPQYGWASASAIDGTIPAGDWTFTWRIRVTQYQTGGTATVQVRVFKATTGTAGTLLFTANGTTNFAKASGTYSETIVSTQASSYTFGANEYLVIEYWMNFNNTGDYAFQLESESTAGLVTFPTPVTATTQIGTGAPQASSISVCPGGAPVFADAFDLSVTAGAADTVTAATVTLAAGTSAGVAEVQIRDGSGATVLGSATTPTGDQWTVGGLSLNAPNGTPAQYRIYVVPKTPGLMPPPPGSTYGVTAAITSIVHSLLNTVVYNDTADGTVSIDNLSPGDAVWGTITPGDAQISLSWTNPADPDFADVLILRDTTAVAASPAEGTSYTAGQTIGSASVVYAGTGISYTDTGLTNGTAYYYKIFAHDACGNYASGAATGPHTPSAPAPGTTVGPASVTANACTQVTVSAPFTGDSNGDGTTDFERGPTATGPWTLVCSAASGASPRTCVDTGVVENTTYYYRVTFADPDGVAGTNPQVVGPVTTPSCAANDTTITSNSALVSACRQISVTSAFTGDDNGNGRVSVEYNTANAWPGTTACADVTGPSPRQCLATNLSPGTQYWLRVTFTDPDGVTGANPEVLGPYTTPSCGTDTAPPTIGFLVPADGATVGGSDVIKVSIYDEGGLAGGTPVRWRLDAGPWSTTITVNPQYNCGPSCQVYEIALDTTTLTGGAHQVEVEATDAAGNLARAGRGFRVSNSGTRPAGTGTLLRRTHGSQICLDCHNIPTHSSQHTGTNYGSWSVDCLTCHTPHGTTNIYLIREQIRTPSSGNRAVVFRQDDRAGATNPSGSYLGASTTDYTDGICEACHTKTNHYRNDASGGDHTHNQSTRCVGCHPHSNGFAAGESKGRASCSVCHASIWDGMTGAVAKTSRHALGNTREVNDSFQDSGVSWVAPLAAVAPADRSCVNMCHTDHVHNTPGSTTHEYDVHNDASTQASRSVSRSSGGLATGGSPAKTDFDAGAANGGLCVSCHRNAVATGEPAVDAGAYSASAHNYTSNAYGSWTYVLHDGSTFDRNCTKCHADRGDGRPSASGTGLGAVHFSSYPKLLSGSINPAGAPADFVCYNCHGNGTNGQDLSGKDLATVMAKSSVHPVESDSAHDTLAENGATYADGAFSGADRHVNCLDCHAPHRAAAGLHSPGSSGLAGALTGATGIGVASLPAGWTVFGSADFTTNLVPVAAEYQICLKCHSSFAFGTSPPSGETDQAQELNVNNDSYHWVMTDQTASSAPTWTTANNTPRTNDPGRVMTFASGSPWTKSSPMVCSDCHGNDDATGVQGPHGSANAPILKKPWSAGSGINTPNGLCFDCHDYQTYAGKDPNFGQSGYATGGGNKNLHGEHSKIFSSTFTCAWCHSAVPHGWKRKALIVLTSDPAPYNAGGNTARIVSWNISNTRQYRKSSCATVGGCH